MGKVMGSFSSLVLIPDWQSFNDLASSGLNPEDVIVLARANLLKENIACFQPFHKVIAVKNYLNSGEVEARAYREYQKAPYQHLIAIQEVDILRAGRLRTLLKLPGQSYESACAFRNKVLMKQILQKTNFRIPAFREVQNPCDIMDFIKDHPFPILLKPNLGTGSQGVVVFHSQTDVFTFLKQSNALMVNQPVDLQIEEFIQGQMYHVNGLVHQGQVVACWPSIYPQPSIRMQQGKYASSYLLHHENPLVPQLNEYAHQVLQALPTPENTAFHLEVFVTPDQEIVFCEIASRIGGKGVRLSWKESFEIDLGKVFIETQAHLAPKNFDKQRKLKPKMLSGEIWFPVLQGTLQSVASKCPFEWVKNYHVFYQAGDKIKGKAKNIEQCLAGISLLTAQTEREMQQRLEDVAFWFHSKTSWRS
jgi:hypothetical protein